MNFRQSPSMLSRRAAAVVDITALIDVVFQLLIFFLLTSSYVSQQATPKAPQVPLDLPETSLEATDQRADDVTVSVDAAGGVFLDGQPVTLEELGVRLAKAANRNPNTIVLIRGDESVAYGRIAEVMTIARASKLKISATLQGP
ncbi:MAG: biopolymer transporter ExbD [Myxococcales bacterium]|nr:biopolymer transporter ExbD [Myxococcales bacterium]MCB9547945.1 biopolymer transporter ExbD [Myxococcales bacterium]